MRWGVLAALALAFAVTLTVRAADSAPLILVSMDAFRWDYCALHPAETRHLRELARDGVSARELIPVFPSNTFPNHYSIVTGLYPAHHGIINNVMFDPMLGEFFHYNQPASSTKSQWWSGEPIWVTAIKQGGLGASWFWPGSEAEIEGVRPTVWRVYDPNLSFEKRLAELVDWLRRSAGHKAVVATLYLEETNSIGHKFGPDSPELTAAVKVADERIGALETQLRDAGIAANLVIVSDHGMTSISPSRVIFLDDYVSPADVQLDFDGPVAGLRPLHGDAVTLMRALAGVAHAKAFRAEDLPARFHETGSARIPPVWLVPEEGWEIYFRRTFAAIGPHLNQADHGYDPAFRSMHGVFIAQGPALKSGVVLDPFENVHIYNLLCAVAGLTPAPNDGDDRLVKAALR